MTIRLRLRGRDRVGPRTLGLDEGVPGMCRSERNNYYCYRKEVIVIVTHGGIFERVETEELTKGGDGNFCKGS